MKLSFLTLAGLVIFCLLTTAQAKDRPFYEDPGWKPRALLPADEALQGDFWPASPAVQVDYDDPGFAKDRLSEVPSPGIHPRVLMTPSDVDRIRAKVALGDKAPAAFQVMWKRVSKNKNGFYALVTKDDVLGKELASQLVAKMNSLEPKLDAMEKHPDRDNLWMLERSIVASGEPDPPSEIFDLIDYDYLSGWMSPEEKEQARRIIARITSHRISNFMMVPDHFMNNNHEGFGMEFIWLLLLIEGEKGFDPQVYKLAAKKARAMLDWYLDADGMCYESIKGWLNISAFVAFGQRERDLLKHDHLRAKMRFFQAAARWEDGKWKIRDEMRASAFHVIWMMHYYHPKDEGIDFLYKATFSTHDFLTDPEAKWPNPVGISSELLLLYADAGMVDAQGKPLEWTDQAKIDSLHFPVTWQDNLRGYVETRNSWKKEDLHVGFTCKQDFFYGGHEGSENNRLILWKDGVNWVQDLNMLATKATFLQNMMTVDGQGCHWPPVAGTWLGVKESPAGVVAAGDGKDGFSYTKSMQIHPLDFPSGKLGYYAPFTEGNFDQTRDLQVAFNPRTIKYNDGYAHTDYGPWSGETRLVENYKSWNPMLADYRTVFVAKGENPYVLVVDDAQKDQQPHEYEWNISVPPDVDLIDAITPEIQFQNTNPSEVREGDLILGKSGTPRDPKSGKLLPQKGDPLCLIRVLWRNSEYGFPVPRFEKFQGYAHVTIPARSRSPEFRILIYPFRQGDPMPKTSWNKERTVLTLELKDRKDQYTFGKADGGRTSLSLERDGKELLSSGLAPARPFLMVRGETFDANAARYTREDGKIPTYLVDESVQVAFCNPEPGTKIRYTLDGSEPVESSNLYETSLTITKTTDLKARVFDPNWRGGSKKSEVLTAHFTVIKPEPGVESAPTGLSKALIGRVYEIKTVLWNSKGFFQASKIMMPNLEAEKPITTVTTSGFELPYTMPTHPQSQQCKAFYRLSGWYWAKEKGIYQFAVDSCGPVTLDVGQQTAIESIGVFHQQQKVRTGEVALDRGWHPIDLVVCDPLFWNINSLEPMPFHVSTRINGGASQLISPSELSCVPESVPNLVASPVIPTVAPMAETPLLEPGLDLTVIDRTGKRRDPDFLDIEGLAPFHEERVADLEPSDSRNSVRDYSGYFHAPVSGIYTFELPCRKGESAGLGALQATFQNQLRLGEQILVQHGVPGRNPLGSVNLKEGWYPLSIRMGPSGLGASVIPPDQHRLLLTGENLFRPVLVSITPEASKLHRPQVEIYAPTKISLVLNTEKKFTLRYTTDGSTPTASSPSYSGPFLIEKTTPIKAIAFDSGKPVTAVATSEFLLTDMPRLGLLGEIDLKDWDGKTGDYPLPPQSPLGFWIGHEGTVVEGRKGKALSMFTSQAPKQSLDGLPKVDVNVSRGSVRAGFKLHHLLMRQNALTIALWMKTSELTGSLFGKDGYNAFGKGYKTLSCKLDNGRLLANPGRLAGGKLEPNVWQHVVLTADEHEMNLYLNGKQVAAGSGTHEIATDALDFFVNNPAAVESLVVYDRHLDPEEVQHLFEKK